MERAIGALRRHDHNIVPLAFLERNFIDPQHGEGRNDDPIHLGFDPAINHTQHGIRHHPFFLAHISQGAIDAHDEHLALVGLREKRFRRI